MIFTGAPLLILLVVGTIAAMAYLLHSPGPESDNDLYVPLVDGEDCGPAERSVLSAPPEPALAA